MAFFVKKLRCRMQWGYLLPMSVCISANGVALQRNICFAIAEYNLSLIAENMWNSRPFLTHRSEIVTHILRFIGTKMPSASAPSSEAYALSEVFPLTPARYS